MHGNMKVKQEYAYKYRSVKWKHHTHWGTLHIKFDFWLIQIRSNYNVGQK